jgi:hypothetical protein
LEPKLLEANRAEQIYLSFTQNRSQPDLNYTPLLAATPIIGTYKNQDGVIAPCAPANAVATVEWVVAYSSLAPGEMAGIDLNQYVKKDEMEALKVKVSEIDISVTKCLGDIKNHSDELVLINNHIRELRDKDDILENKLSTQDKTIQSMINDPFPDGFILICGEQ